IPIVLVASDPVNFSIVASLSHPGGNATGISNLATDLPRKSTQLLRQLRPDVKTIALLVNPTNLSASVHAKQASQAANVLMVELRVIGAERQQEIDKSFAEMAKLGISVLEVPPDAFLDSQRERIVELSAKNGITGCYPWREYVVAGGVMSYGTTLA